MDEKERCLRGKRPFTAMQIIGVFLIIFTLVGCGGPSAEELEAIDYTPLPGGDWELSTPEEEGVDPLLVAEMYHDAAELETLYGLLVVKNGRLIAEGYFNEGSIDEQFDRASATKSFTSALVGIALEQGCLSSVDQKMIDFFPEYADQITDPRKAEITIRDLLQMRGGYPDEEYTPPYMEILYWSDNWHHVPHLVDFPLTSDPRTEFQYSNLTSHLLAVVVARACDTDLMSFSQEYLFTPLGGKVGDWYPDADNYHLGGMGIFVSARDMAKFGQCFLNGGQYDDQQVITADWVNDSLQSYSANIRRGGSNSYGSFRDIGYGYQWWSGRVGGHDFNYAAGHGGNYIILLHDLDMVIVTTADPMHGVFGSESWQHEGAINNLVADFVASLPEQ
ncbi:serine hydrolase domain-containing protein [Candidatus Leptofilum sp.]|uniref:serine hydrolase domain-containing protein n=1 Tax=Candidatus Leptofilum sp. TaxID=3241576 RepID=UPI003B5CE34D